MYILHKLNNKKKKRKKFLLHYRQKFAGSCGNTSKNINTFLQVSVRITEVMEQRNSSSSRSGSSRESTGLADRVMYEQQCVYQYERDERKEWKQERVDGQQMLMMKQEEMQQKRFENDCKTNKTEQQCMSEWKQEQGDRHYHSRHHHRKNDEHGNGHTDRDDIHTRASELMMRFETLWERYGKKAKPSDTRSASLNKSETMTSWGNDFVKKSVVQQLFPPKGQLHAHNQSMQPIPQSDTSTKNSSQYTIKEKNEHAPQNTFDNMHQNNHDRNNLENFEPQNHLLKSVLTEFPQQQGSETDMSLPEHLYNSRTNILKEQTKTPEATFHSEDILPASFSRLWTGRRSDEYQNDQKNANYSVQANHDTYQGDVSQTRSSSKTNDYFTTEEDSDESVATYCIRTDHDDDEDDQSIKNRKIALSGLPEIRTISPTASYYTKETFDRNTMGSNRERSNNSTLYKTKWPDDIKSNVRQSNRNASQMDKQHTQNNLEYAATTIQSAWYGSMLLSTSFVCCLR